MPSELLGRAVTRPSRVAALTAATRAELLRVRGLRSMWWLVGTSWSVFVLIGVVSSVTVPSGGTAGSALSGADTAPIITGFAALVFFAADLGSGAIGATLLIVPSRRLVLVAKLAAVSVIALCSSIGNLTTAVLIAWLTRGSSEQPRPGLAEGWVSAAQELWWVALCFALLGAGIGMLLSNLAGAVSVYLLVLLALPLLAALTGIWLADVSRLLLEWMPATLTTQILERYPHGDGLVRFLVIDVVLIALGATRFMRRNVR
jgi:hypothetical protein